MPRDEANTPALEEKIESRNVLKQRKLGHIAAVVKNYFAKVLDSRRAAFVYLFTTHVSKALG